MVLFGLVFGDVKQITRWNSGSGMKAEEQVIEMDGSITRPIISLDSEAQVGTRHLCSSHVGGHCDARIGVWTRDTTPSCDVRPGWEKLIEVLTTPPGTKCRKAEPAVRELF